MNELAHQAKERQRLAGGDRTSVNYREAVTQKIVEPLQEIPIPVIEETNRSARESNAKIAAALGTNRQYVSDAKPMFTCIKSIIGCAIN